MCRRRFLPVRGRGDVCYIPAMKATIPDSFLDRTMAQLRRAWEDYAPTAIGGREGPRPELPKDDARRLKSQMRDCLQGTGGEVSARARAAALGHTYLDLNAKGRQRFLELLAHEFGTDRDAVDAAALKITAAPRGEQRYRTESALRSALQPPRRRLLTQFNALPDGTKFLVDMRAEAMTFARANNDLRSVEGDLREMFELWFDVGFLELRRITWDSPAALLEKLIDYEAVHEIEGWPDLKNRLDSDRRLFAFFHPRMPDEPLIFVEVALVDGLAGNIQHVLDQNAPRLDPREADTAIFYSISNCQEGLAGISFGNFLIKRVVDHLRSEFANLKTFSTLSPIPGFGSWLDEQLAALREDKGKSADSPVGEALLTPAERKALTALEPAVTFEAAMKRLILDSRWHEDRPLAKVLQAPLMRLCARYLVEEKRRDGQARDPVAHFHLTNGARVERLNWLADTSPKGRLQSAGMMVNYLYRLADIEKNHEAYTGKGKIAMASDVKGLVK